MNPTMMELTFDGSYLGKWASLEVYRYGNKFYGIGNRIVELNEVDLALMYS